MTGPPRRFLLRITALVFALGAAVCYVWQAQVKQTIRHVSGTKRSNSIVDADAKPWISGTKNITQPVFSTRSLTEQSKLLWDPVFPPPPPEPSVVFGNQALDYPGYPPPTAADGEAAHRAFPSTKSVVPLIKVQPPEP